MDLRNSELNGQHAEDRLSQIEIAVNRNAVGFDPRPSMVSSGPRRGTRLRDRVSALADKFPPYRGVLS